MVKEFILRTEDLKRGPLLLGIPVGKVLRVRWASILSLDLLGDSDSAGGGHLQLSDVARNLVDGLGRLDFRYRGSHFER